MNPISGIREQLYMGDGKRQLDVRRHRVNVNKNSCNLVIGLGGTGVQALVEAKGLIDLTCECADQDVAYTGFDTDMYTFEDLKSSPNTGSATLNENENVLLKTEGLATVFAPAMIQKTKQSHLEYFGWVNERLAISNPDTGAGGIRQLGRLMLMKNHDSVSGASQATAQQRRVLWCSIQRAYAKTR